MGDEPVERAEYETFKRNVVRELAEIKAAITADARSRAKRDELIAEELAKLTSKLEHTTRTIPVAWSPKRLATFSGLGAAVAELVIEIVRNHILH